MGLFDKVNNLKNRATSVIDTSKNKLHDAARTTRRVANRASKANWTEIGHAALDVAGFVPVVGGVADMANAGWYAAKGDWKNASLSAASAVPGVGDAFAAGKIAVKAGGAVASAAAVSRAGRVNNNLNKVKKVTQTGTNPVQRATVINQPRDNRGRFAPNPNLSPNRTSKHRSLEYRRAQDELKRKTIDDDKAPKHMRGWLRNQRNQWGDNPRKWKNPKGYDTGHVNPNDNTKLRWETSSQNRSRGAKFRR